jgi:hypothetical protein
VVFQKPQEQTYLLPPPRTLIMDFSVTLTCCGRSNLHPMRQLTDTRLSDGTPEPDGVFKTVTTVKIIHYRQVSLNRSNPIVFLPIVVDTSGHIYEDFRRLLVSILTRSGQFCFLRSVCLDNLKGSVVLTLVKTSVMRISIPLE